MKKRIHKVIKKLPKPSVPSAIKPARFRERDAERRAREAFANVPRITNETVAEHREDVLSGARKYIYPLQHSRRNIVVISTSLFIVSLIGFSTYVAVALYKFQSTSGFLYGVTKVVPLPVAKAGSSWVSYNSYLFELRHYMHYYHTQQQVDFSTKDGKEQLVRFKKESMNQVVADAYVKQLAKKYDVRVTSRQVSDQITLVRSQNRLGTSNHEYEAVLSEYWGWTPKDFARELQQEMLTQAVVSKLDTATHDRANAAFKQLQQGADFATVASQVSEDPVSKANGGQYATAVDPTDASIAPAVMAELRQLGPGQTSGIINTGFTLEILKVNGVQNGKIQASHIVFNFQPIDAYTAPLVRAHPARHLIKT